MPVNFRVLIFHYIDNLPTDSITIGYTSGKIFMFYFWWTNLFISLGCIAQSGVHPLVMPFLGLEGSKQLSFPPVVHVDWF